MPRGTDIELQTATEDVDWGRRSKSLPDLTSIAARGISHSGALRCGLVHLEWGLPGLREAGRQADVVVVVDVITFSTAVTVAAERGVFVHPHRSNDEYAVRMAAALGAHLAGPRGSAVSLSPGTFARLPAGDRVLLPSPNGGALALEAAATGATVVAGSLRNASAVGTWLSQQPRRVVVVAVGEQWRDGTPRVAVEDLFGAGAILAAVPDDQLSAEALIAAGAFRANRSHALGLLRSCTSGRELAARGFTEDIRWAADVDATDVIPTLVEGAFRSFAAP